MFEKQFIAIRKNKFFLKVLLVMTSCSLLAGGLSGNYVYRDKLRSQYVNIDSNNLLMVQRIETLVTRSLYGLVQSSRQMVWNANFVKATIAPEYMELSEYQSIYQELLAKVSFDDVVLTAYFYAPYSDSVYQSDGNITTLENMVYSDIIKDHQQRLEDVSAAKGEGYRNYYLTSNGEILVFGDLIAAKYLGSVIYLIDMDGLIGSCWNDEGGYNWLVVLTGDQQRLFGDEERFQLMLSGGGNFITEKNYQQGGDDRGSKEHMYYHQSASNDWQYVLGADLMAAWTNGDFLVLYAPIFLIIIGAFLILILYINRSIFSPIRRAVIDHVGNTGLSESDSELVMDYFVELYQSYSKALAEKRKMNQLVTNLADNLLDQMLHSLIAGKVFDLNILEDLLCRVRAPISADDKCQALLLRLFPAEREAGQEQLIHDLNRLSGTGGGYAIPLVLSREEIVFLIFYDSASMETECENQYRQNLDRILALFGRRNITVQVGRGTLKKNILGCRSSFQEARIDLQSRQECLGCSEESFLTVVRATVQEFVIQSKNSSWEQMGGLMQRFEAEWKKSKMSDDQMSALCCLYFDHLIRGLMRELRIGGKQEADWFQLRKESIEGFSESEDHLDWIRRQTQKVLEYHDKVCLNPRYQYVREAVMKIEKDFLNVSLNRDSLADSIGISGSYLGTLFIDYTGKDLNSYLNCYRIEYAQKLLGDSYMTIKEIGEKCGFASTQSFIRIFKRYMGQTPGKYQDDKHSKESLMQD